MKFSEEYIEICKKLHEIHPKKKEDWMIGDVLLLTEEPFMGDIVFVTDIMEVRNGIIRCINGNSSSEYPKIRQKDLLKKVKHPLRSTSQYPSSMASRMLRYFSSDSISWPMICFSRVISWKYPTLLTSESSSCSREPEIRTGTRFPSLLRISVS